MVKVTLAAICGSDLSVYRQRTDRPHGQLLGHEFVGRVAAVGPDVTSLHQGDLVAAPFSWSDGTCAQCRAGWHSSCVAGGFWGRTPGSGGAQAEYVRVPFAEQTLVPLPPDTAESLLPALLLTGDVLATGTHGAALANVLPGSRIAVVGDGPVGLCAALAAHRRGADEVVIFGHHPGRAELATAFGGAVWRPSPSGPDAVAHRFDSVIECVGSAGTIALSVALTRDGGTASFVGVPHGVRAAPIAEMFRRNVGMHGGITPARRYMPALINDVLARSIEPSPMIDLQLPLSEAGAGYARLHARKAIKVLLNC